MVGRVLLLLGLALIVSTTAASAQTVFDRTVDRSGASVLQLEAGGAAIVLTPTPDSSTIHIRVDQGKSAPVPALQSIKAGNRLSLTLRPPSAAPLIPFVPSAGATYSIAFPASMRLDLRISSGDVRLNGPAASVEIYDQDGNIDVDSPRASITAENGRGDIDVTNAYAPIDLAADDGNVNAVLASGWSGNEVRIQSGTGSIHLTVPKGFRGKFDASSDSGNVHNALAASGARTPLVWLYAIKGDVFVAQTKP